MFGSRFAAFDNNYVGIDVYDFEVGTEQRMFVAIW